MAIAPTSAPSNIAVDARGRAIPRTAEEIRQRAREGIRALDALDDMGDEDEQRRRLEALVQALDDDRRSSRRRPV